MDFPKANLQRRTRKAKSNDRILLIGTLGIDYDVECESDCGEHNDGKITEEH